MPVTAKELARELNLSQPTVSRILSGDTNHRAAAATRERVMEAAKRLGYQPNAVASSLRRGRTDIIGLHTSYDYDVRNEFLGAIVGSLQRACSAHSLDVLLHSALSGVSAREMFGKLRDGRIDGLILHSPSDDPLVGLLRKSNFPVVVVADPLPGMTSVTSDDAGGMELLIAHLWERGYRQFAFVAPRSELASVERRRIAFDCELEKRALPATNFRTFAIDFEHTAPVLPELLAVAHSVGERLAVCCWNDRAAHNLLGDCARNGVSVPQTLAITGFDGFTDDKLPARQLVTAICPWEAVAATALEQLRALIDARGQKSAASKPAPQETCLPVQLRIGDTT